VAAVAVALPAVVGWWMRNQRVASLAPVRSRAVLPIDNPSGDPDQEYFVDGMAEDLITRLSIVASA
jgi:TolB-like protein